MEDTGLVCLLVADHVGPPTEEGPEVHVRVRGVADPALARPGLEGGGGEEGGGEGVVEGPGEAVRGWEAPHPAAHLHRLVLGDAVDHVLAVVTYRGVCRERTSQVTDRRGWKGFWVCFFHGNLLLFGGMPFFQFLPI